MLAMNASRLYKTHSDITQEQLTQIFCKAFEEKGRFYVEYKYKYKYKRRGFHVDQKAGGQSLVSNRSCLM